MTDRAFYGTHLSLPKNCINGLQVIKSMLEFPYNETKVKSWTENKTHITVPREFLSIDEYKNLPFPVQNTNPTEYPEVNVSLTYSLRSVIQEKAFESLGEGSGLLVLSCGKGKTVISLHAWAQYRVPAVVIVPKLDLAYQWKSRICEHTNLEESDIGWIQGDPSKWDWRGKPIAIAVLKTVAMYPGGFTKEFQEHFGIAIYDEVHRLGAPYFNSAAGICCGIRWGLSATPFRKDGLDQIYRYHLGEVLYENLTHDNIPKTYFLQSGITLTPSDEKKVLSRGDINFAKLTTWLSENKLRNNIIKGAIKEALDNERTILVLSDRVQHLKLLHEEFPGSGILHGAIKGEERENELQNNRLVFASTKIAKEGLDKKTLNTVFILTPLSDEGTFTQIIGRSQRGADPMVVIVEDKISMCQSMCNTLKRILKKKGYPFYKMEVKI